MSKLSFRSRQVDYNKPLPIYLNHDLPDLQDFAAINRTVPQMPTGMEKDEEAEHHLQRALSAFQAFGVTSTQDYAIPTPRVEIDDKLYERIYENYESIKQKQYIRIQPFSNDYEYPDYDADWEDQQWVKEQQQAKPVDFSDDLCLFFETVMDCLEKATGFSMNVMTREEAAALLKKEAYTHTSEENEFLKRKLYGKQYETEKEAFLVSVYEYWKAKRLRLRHPLTPTVMTDKSGVVTAPNNPYLVFRRRTEKMQTRKNRKNEEHSYENMLILKRDLLRAQQILRVIKQRESLKKDLLKLTLDQVEKRFKANDFDGSMVEGIKNTLRPPSLSHHNTNSQTAIAAGLLVSNPALLKQLGIAPHQLDSKTLTNLLQQNPRLKSFVSSVATNAAAANAAAVSAAAASANKKPGLAADANKKLVVGKKNLVNHSTSSSSSSGDHLKSSALTNHQRLNQLSATQLNSSKKSTTVNSNNINSKLSQMNSVTANGQKSSLNKYGELMGNKSSLDVVNSNKRRLVRPGGSVDPYLNAVANPGLLADIEENNEFVEALKANDIGNLEATLDEYKSCFESEGTYRFNRKEGCKYLPPSGSLFKSDPFELSQTLNKLSRTEYIAHLSESVSSVSPSSSARGLVNTNNNISDRYSSKINTGEIANSVADDETNKETSQQQRESSRPIGCAASLLGSGYNAPPAHLKMNNPKRIRQLRELHYKYYGYVRAGNNKHLGLVRRRLGRNGRVILERFDPDTVDLLRNPDDQPQGHHVNHHSIVSAEQQLYSFDIYSKFKTYYPIDCFEPASTAENINSATSRLTLRLDANRANSGGYDDDDDESETEEDDESSMVPDANHGVRYDHTLFPIYYPTYEDNVKDTASSSMEVTEDTEAPVTDPRVDSLFKELFSYRDDQYGESESSMDDVEFRADRNIIQLNLKSEAKLNQEYQERRTFHNTRFVNEKNDDDDCDDVEDDDSDNQDQDELEVESFGGEQDKCDSRSNELSASDIKLALRVFQLPKVSNSDMSIIDKNNNINSDCDERMTEPAAVVASTATTTTSAIATPSTTTNNQPNGNGSVDISSKKSLSLETSSHLISAATTSVIPTKSAGSVNPGVGLDTTTGGTQLVNSKPNKSEPLNAPSSAITTTSNHTSSLIESSPIILKKQPNIIYSKSTISSLLQNSPSSVIQTTMFYSPSNNNSNNSSTSTSSLPSSSSVSSSSSLVNGPTATSGTLTNGPSTPTGLLPTANIINGILSKKQDEYQDNHVSSSATASSINQSVTSDEQEMNNKLEHHINHLNTSSTTSKTPVSATASLIVAAATTTTPNPP